MRPKMQLRVSKMIHKVLKLTKKSQKCFWCASVGNSFACQRCSFQRFYHKCEKRNEDPVLNMFFVINLLSVRMSDVSYELSYQLSALVSCNQDLDKDLTLTQA